MACEDCATKFGILRRPKTCNDCSYDFCSSCIMTFKGAEKQQRCRRCRVLFSFPLDKNAVSNLRVRDLKWYLGRLAVSVQGYREKSELVELVMLHSGTYFAGPPNYNRTNISRTEPEPYNSVHTFPTGTRSAPHSPGPSRNYRHSQGRKCKKSGSKAKPSSTSGSHENVSYSCPQSPPTQRDCSTSILNCRGRSEDSMNVDSFKPMSIEDITSPDQIAHFSVRQLKLILTRSFVDYRGCCEKQELQDRVMRLWSQKNEQKTDIEAISDENMCKICMQFPIDSVLLECGHMVTCTDCGKRLHECPICRQYVVRVVHTFKA